MPNGTNVSQLLSIISQIRAARAAEEFEQMSAAELMQRIAEAYSHDKDEQRLYTLSPFNTIWRRRPDVSNARAGN